MLPVEMPHCIYRPAHVAPINHMRTERATFEEFDQVQRICDD